MKSFKACCLMIGLLAVTSLAPCMSPTERGSVRNAAWDAGSCHGGNSR